MRHVTRKQQRGVRLKEARKAAGMSQQKLSAATGIDRSAISNMERGEIGYGEGRAEILARALGVTVTDLLGSPEEEAAERSREEAHLDDLLESIATRADGVDALLAEALQLLTRRLRLVEQRQAQRDRRATRVAG